MHSFGFGLWQVKYIELQKYSFQEPPRRCHVANINMWSCSQHCAGPFPLIVLHLCKACTLVVGGMDALRSCFVLYAQDM